MGLVVWVMMGIAVWHFTVFLPDRFWGGIVGAFFAAIVGAALFGFIVNGLTCPGRNDTRADPGAHRRARLADRARRLVLLGRARGPRPPAWTTASRAPAHASSTGAASAGPRPFRPGRGPTMARMDTCPSRWSSAALSRWPARCDSSATLGVSATVAAVLARRGLADPEEARRFLAADERHDPMSLPGLPRRCAA